MVMFTALVRVQECDTEQTESGDDATNERIRYGSSARSPKKSGLCADRVVPTECRNDDVIPIQ